MKVAYAGAFANLVELYTNIPSVNAFDEPAYISETSLNVFCNQINQMPYDVIFVNSIQKPIPSMRHMPICDNMLLLISQKIDGKVYVHRNFATKHPQQWHQMNEILCPNVGFRWDSTINEEVRFCESK
jgi:hypothetical protein